MSNQFKFRLPRLDVDNVSQTIERALGSAGLDAKSGRLQGIAETIRNALARHEPRGQPRTRVDAQPAGDASKAPGEWITRQYTGRAGTRSYKLYVPRNKTSPAPMALVVMLHGCTQSADDFAAGTQMNRLAEEQGFLVAYPEQSSSANPSKCWNWFKAQDQRRDDGEPSLVAGIVAEVIRAAGADPRRVFVAGLSAGAAMAVIMGETYPDVFAAVGVHSGLPYASAHDVPSAMAAMKGGRSGLPHLSGIVGVGPAAKNRLSHAVPTIVFHGDRDHTVQFANGGAIVEQALDAHAAAGGRPLDAATTHGASTAGRRYSRTVFTDHKSCAQLESWTIEGAGHAWSGGHPAGSYTDALGPDASAEMVRFFFALLSRR